MMKIGIVIALLAVVAGGAYVLTNNPDIRGGKPISSVVPASETFPQDVSDLPEAKPTEEVFLKGGEVYDLEIVPVKKKIGDTWVRMLSYNGSVPGPVLRAPEGADVTIRLKNGGDLETTLHSHGLRLENLFDGVPGVTQEPIKVGDTFEYRLKFPDPGMYWYHPHVRTDYGLEIGLYGTYIVDPKDTGYWSPVNRELSVTLDDIALGRNGRPLPFDRDEPDHTLMGRFGNTMFVNGETKYRLEAKRGEVIRLYLVNTANVRPFDFSIPGAKMKLVGADLGRYAREKFVESVFIAPGERRIVEVYFEKSGTLPIEHRTPEKTYRLGEVSVSDDPIAVSFADAFSVLRQNPSVVAEMNPLLDAYLSREPDKELRLSMAMGEQMGMQMSPHGMHEMGGGMMMENSMMGMGDDDDTIEWEDTMREMNEGSTTKTLTWKFIDGKTGKENMNIDDWKFKKGDRVKIRIVNDTDSMHPMQHPIHFHGQRFLVLSTNGVRNDNPVWQDTLLLPKGDTADIVVDMTSSGDWAAHCHIVEHAEAGMMMVFRVEE